jgi:hypothetical protein
MIQSDEEREARAKELQKQAAEERYKADLFAWGSNVITATAQAAMAVMNALQTTPFPVGVAMAAIATALGATQIASVISAKPKPPRFHEGGVVQGRSGQEVSAVLKAGEVVSTKGQFNDIMGAFANLASMKGGDTQLNVKVVNNMGGQAQVSQKITEQGLIVIVDQIVNNGLASGKYQSGIEGNNIRNRGVALET